MAEGVDEAALQKFGEASAFLIGEAGGLAVFFGAGEVDLVVRDVEVAAENDGLRDGEGVEVLAERGVPLKAVGEAA